MLWSDIKPHSLFAGNQTMANNIWLVMSHDILKYICDNFNMHCRVMNVPRNIQNY